jgi:hypothetical protein
LSSLATLQLFWFKYICHYLIKLAGSCLSAGVSGLETRLDARPDVEDAVHEVLAVLNAGGDNADDVQGDQAKRSINQSLVQILDPLRAQKASAIIVNPVPEIALIIPSRARVIAVSTACRSTANLVICQEQVDRCNE